MPFFVPNPAAPRSAASSTADQGHAGAYREIIKRLDVLKEMESVEVAREQEESQGHMMIPHRQNPVTFVQTNDRCVPRAFRPVIPPSFVVITSSLVAPPPLLSR